MGRAEIGEHALRLRPARSFSQTATATAATQVPMRLPQRAPRR